MTIRARGGMGGSRAHVDDDLSRLALAAGAGDHVALRRFVSATQPHVWQLCAFLGSKGSADDLLQETYLRAIHSLPRYRAEAPAIHWLSRIARNVCADEVRRNRRRRETWLRLARTAEADGGLAYPPCDVELDDVLRRIPEGRREAFVLTQLHGFSYPEAADVLECPIGTIRSRVARARADLAALARAAELV